MSQSPPTPRNPADGPSPGFPYNGPFGAHPNSVAGVVFSLSGFAIVAWAGLTAFLAVTGEYLWAAGAFLLMSGYLWLGHRREMRERQEKQDPADRLRL